MQSRLGDEPVPDRVCGEHADALSGLLAGRQGWSRRGSSTTTLQHVRSLDHQPSSSQLSDIFSNGGAVLALDEHGVVVEELQLLHLVRGHYQSFTSSHSARFGRPPAMRPPEEPLKTIEHSSVVTTVNVAPSAAYTVEGSELVHHQPPGPPTQACNGVERCWALAWLRFAHVHSLQASWEDWSRRNTKR